MKTIYLLIICFLLSGASYGQNSETYQTSEIYKANKVKYRISRAELQNLSNNITDLFDRDGWQIAEYNFDSSGFKVESKTIRSYDKVKHGESKFTYFYKRYDSLKKRDSLYSYPDSSKTITYKIVVDTVTYTRTETGYNPLGKIVVTKKYFREPLSLNINYFENDTLIENTTIQFESLWVERKVTGTIKTKNGTTETYEWNFKNKFDKAGKLIERKVSKTETLPNKQFPQPYFTKCNYEYNSKGLLIRKTLQNPSDGRDLYLPIKFEYIYYD